MVAIEDDRHAGHTVGVLAAAAPDRDASPLPKPGEFIDLKRT